MALLVHESQHFLPCHLVIIFLFVVDIDKVLVLVLVIVYGLVLTQRQAAAAKGREVLAVCAARGREAVLLVALAFLADRRQAPVKRRLKLVRLGLQVVGGRGGGGGWGESLSRDA